MSYSMIGLGADTYKVSGSVCKPTDLATLDKFKQLQSQLNRVANGKGLGTITVDGDLGPATVALYNKVVPAASQVSSCAELAQMATGVALAAVTAIANALGYPPPPAPAQPSKPVQRPDGTVYESAPPEQGSLLNRVTDFVMSPTGLATLGGLGLVVYLMRRKKGASTPAAASAPIAAPAVKV